MSRPNGNTNGKPRKPYERPRPRASDGAWLHDMAPALPSSITNTGRGQGVNKKLVVSNLHYNVTAKDLIAIFGQIGTLVREPLIKYDRSGRSTGVAIITYETPVEATRAKNQFSGILAKGQPMIVTFDTAPPHGKVAARRAVSAPTLLMDRISNPPLLDRLASDVPSQKDVIMTASGGGPVRNRKRHRSARPEKTKKGPKTAEDLDKELDAFMGDDAKTTPASAADGAQASGGDVEMAA